MKTTDATDFSRANTTELKLDDKGAIKMAKTISYDKLWKLVIDKKMNRTELKEKSGISTASLAKLGKNENLTTAILLKICSTLDCNISDIMEVIDDPSQE